MKIKLHDFPFNKDFVFTITIDDLHPESKGDAEHLDFGSSIKKEPLKFISQVIKENPEIKFTLFTVPNWTDRSDIPNGWLFPLRKLWRKRRMYKEDAFDISQKKYANWVKEINSFYPENIEISPHGLFHHNENTKYFRSEELGGLTKEEIEELLDKAEDLFKRSGLRSSKGFRPPGWYTPKILLEILNKENYVYLAASSDMQSPIEKDVIAETTGLRDQFLIKGINNDGLYSFTANCYPHQISRAVEIAKLKAILMVHCHIASTEFGLIALGKNYPKQIKKMIQEIRYQTGFEPCFATLEELAKFLYAKESLEWESRESEITFRNKSAFDLKGLTFTIENKTYVVPLIKAQESKIIELKKEKNEETLRPASLRGEQAQGKKVSIVLTVFNGEKTVKESLNSLVNQTYSNTEIVVVNDGSTDNSEKIVKDFIKQTEDKRIILINQENKGRGAAKNKGLEKSSGEYIAFCEDDAVYSKDYLRLTIDALSNSYVLGVIGPHFVSNKNITLLTRAKDIERRRNFFDYHPKTGWVFRKEDLQKINGFDESLEFGEDADMSTRLKKKFPKRQFIFEKNAIWLHKEPYKFLQCLKRKWKGGIGMALLQKQASISFSPLKNVLFSLVPVALIVGIVIFLIHPLLSALLFFAFIVILIGSRYKSILLGKILSNENNFMIVTFIMIEYIWWGATLAGIYTGYLLPVRYVKRVLRGR